jgi:hypothetical protein
MMKIGWITRQPKGHSTRTMALGSVGAGVALLLALSGIASAQAPQPGEVGGQNGYVVHHTADLGGHIANVAGSGSMYDTLVNIHSGPRVLGESFSMRPAESLKHPVFDSLSAFSSGFGGDPNNFAKLDISKAKIYEFAGIFRRDRQYFDYNLLGNGNTGGITVPYGLAAGQPTAAALPWQSQAQRDSPLMFNSVRRMTNVDLTLLPLSVVTFHVGYSTGIFQGPSLSPGRSIGKYNNLMTQYQRNGTDDFTAAVDWKPWQHTKLTFEEQIERYKADSYWTLSPGSFNVQEADGTLASLGNYDSLGNPYTISACNPTSMGSGYTDKNNYTILSAPSSPGGLPIINPACDVATSYMRSQPTRVLYPTEMLRFQSTSIRNLAMNGDLRYSVSTSKMPNYYESWTGLDGVNATTTAPIYPAQAIRAITLTGAGSAQRRVVGVDLGMTWNATDRITLSDQIDFSNVHQPGTTNVTSGITQNAPTDPNRTINYSGPLVPGAVYNVTGNPNGTQLWGAFGQKFLTNNATATWDVSTRATVSLTYRYGIHNIVQMQQLATSTGGVGTPTVTEVDINQNAGIFNAALRPTNHWDLNGTAEIGYFDNALTPMSPRQTKHFRVHTLYRAKPWMTLSGAFNDLERHNNSNNTGVAAPDGPLQHVDYNRTVSFGAVVAKSDRWGFDFNYSYSDVYISTNACYANGASATLPGAAQTTSSGAPNLCPDSTNEWGPVKDFMDAPTQYASMALLLTPNKRIHSDIGYRISAVSGSQFFQDAQAVNGSLQSAYQSPFVNIAWTVHPGWVWRAEYNYYGYGEGGPSGAQFCSTSTTATSAVVPCSTLSLTGVNEPSSGLTAPRNFHANNVTIGMHYEF